MSTRRILVVLFVAALAASRAAAQKLVADLTPGPHFEGFSSSAPREFRALGNSVLFVAGEYNGTSLWKSDGTPAGTKRVKNIVQGYWWRTPRSLTESNGVVFFAADAEGVGEELWKTDGTEEGTVLVKDVFPGPGSSEPQQLTMMDGILYFVATTPEYDRFDLWRSDGTESGTRIVKEFVRRSGRISSALMLSETGRLAFGKRLYFVVVNVGRSTLWTSDGTSGGTQPLIELCTCEGSVSSSAVFDGDLYFGYNSALWRSDGTRKGTFSLPNAGTNPSSLVVAGRKLFYKAGGLWTFDGSVATQISEINTWGDIAVLHDRIVFAAYTDALGRELFTSDGTAAGTVPLIDLMPGRAASEPAELTTVGDFVYFAASVNYDRELWKTDGTSAGTTRVADIAEYGGSKPRYLTAAGGYLFFSATGDTGGLEPYRSDGTWGGTILLADIAPDVRSSEPMPAGAVGNELLFVAWPPDGNRQQQLFATRGSPATTREIGSSTPAYAAYGQFSAVTIGAQTFIILTDHATEKLALWRTDGGTLSRIDSWLPVGDLIDVNGRVYFAAENAFGLAAGTECGIFVISSSGKSSGLVKKFDRSCRLTGTRTWAGVNDTLFFRVGFTLWKSDGTTNGTRAVATFANGLYDSTAFNGRLYFAANDELWTSDGTPEGTRALTGTIFPQHLTVAGGTLFFTASDKANGRELWKTDGTTVTIARDIASGPGTSTPFSLTAAGSTLFFFAEDGTHGVEPWKSDGTEAGTVMVRDIRPGPIGCGTIDWWPPFSDGRRFWFAANDGTTGVEPWRSDGTEAGTKRAGDVVPGALGSMPYNWSAVGNRMYFSAMVMPYGRELWTLCASDTATLSVDGKTTVVAGAPSTIAVTALDATAARTGCYDGTVRFASSDPIVTLPTNTSLTNDEDGSETYSVILRTAGTRTITVTDIANPAIAGTTTITVVPAAASASTSLIAASHAAILANGTSTTTITIRLRDSYGNAIATGGAVVTLVSTAGTLSNVIDHGDGSYSATLRSPAAPATTTITGTVNGITIDSNASVQFVAYQKRRGA